MRAHVEQWRISKTRCSHCSRENLKVLKNFSSLKIGGKRMCSIREVGEHLKYKICNHKASACSRMLPVQKVLKEIRRRTYELKIVFVTHPVKPLHQTVKLGIAWGANQRCKRPICLRDCPARCGLHNRRHLHPTVQS